MLVAFEYFTSIRNRDTTLQFRATKTRRALNHEQLGSRGLKKSPHEFFGRRRSMVAGATDSRPIFQTKELKVDFIGEEGILGYLVLGFIDHFEYCLTGE